MNIVVVNRNIVSNLSRYEVYIIINPIRIKNLQFLRILDKRCRRYGLLAVFRGLSGNLWGSWCAEEAVRQIPGKGDHVGLGHVNGVVDDLLPWLIWREVLDPGVLLEIFVVAWEEEKQLFLKMRIGKIMLAVSMSINFS